MKRVICILLAFCLLTGCTQRVVAPVAEHREPVSIQPATAEPTVFPSPAPTSTVEPTAVPRPVLSPFAPAADPKPFFAEEVLSHDGEPIASLVYSLLEAERLSKQTFYDRFLQIIDTVDGLESSLQDLASDGRTLTADRKERTASVLHELMSQDAQDTLRSAYAYCPGEGETLPIGQYAAAIDALLQVLQQMEDRTEPFFSLDAKSARDYRAALDRYMGEPIVPRTVFDALEELAQTEAYAIATALQADPEAVRRKEPISFGSYTQNISFLRRITDDLCPLPDGSVLPIPLERGEAEGMDLLSLAFHTYPGMAFLSIYASRSQGEQQARWANAPYGYLGGLAIHCSYSVIPYLDDFRLDYVQYRWYEDMLDVTLTGLSALLIHYYGYSEKDLAEYLKSWGAESFAGYLYEKAMSDPFESLVASYGYCQYLDICQAALDAGCETEQRFLQDYLSAGPAPFAELKEYMVGLYTNQG